MIVKTYDTTMNSANVSSTITQDVEAPKTGERLEEVTYDTNNGDWRKKKRMMITKMKK